MDSDDDGGFGDFEVRPLQPVPWPVTLISATLIYSVTVGACACRACLEPWCGQGIVPLVAVGSR